MILNNFEVGSVVNLDGSICSGSEFRCESQRKAACLKFYGVQEQEYVLISHGDSSQFLTDLFAVWLVGGCAVCVNSGVTDNERKRLSDVIRPKVELVSSGNNRKSDGDFEILNLDEKLADGFNEICGLPGGGHLDDDALVLFTSGTTGVPKGVVHSFRSLYTRILSNLSNFEQKELSSVLCPLPTYFGHGLIGLCLTTLLSRGKLVLCGGSSIKTASRFGGLIDEHQITFLSSVPSLWRMVLRLSPPPRSESLRRIFVGSAPLSAELWAEIVEWSGGKEVVNVYGITETANWIGGASSKMYRPRDGLVGRVWSGRASVLTDSGELLSDGEGEILVQTPSLMRGYFRLPEESTRCLIGGYFKTGDLGCIDKHQNIFIHGRLKSQINRAGVKIIPEEIDILFEKHHWVSEACAFAISDNIAGELIGVAVVPSFPKDKKVSDERLIDELREWLKSKISADKVEMPPFFGHLAVRFSSFHVVQNTPFPA